MAEDEWQLPYDFDGLAQINRLTGLLGGNVAGGLEVKGSGEIRSFNYVAGSAGWRIDGDGNVEFNNGTFRGDLDAVGGTFSGTLDAADGTFAGTLSAVDGTFTGTLSSVDGTFTGTLSGGAIDIGGSDATSFHVDTDGNMWLGSGDYATAVFKVSNAGAVVASSMTITGGSISIGGTDIASDGDVQIGPTAGLYIDQATGDLWFGAATIGSALFAVDASTGNMRIAGDMNVDGGDLRLGYDGSTWTSDTVQIRVGDVAYIGSKYVSSDTHTVGTDKVLWYASDTSGGASGMFINLVRRYDSLPSNYHDDWRFNIPTDSAQGTYRFKFGGNDYFRLTWTSSSSLAEFLNVRQLRVPDGSVSEPGFSFNNQSDAGLFKNATDQISIATGGQNMMRFQNDGSGRIIYSETIRLDTTSGTTANLRMNATSGRIQRDTSTRRHKQNIRYGLANLADTFFDRIRPVSFDEKATGEARLGLIAEDLAEVDHRLVSYYEGRPESVEWWAVIALLVEEVRRLRGAHAG